MAGFKSYIIAGGQTSYDIPAILSEMTGKIYEFVSSTVKNTSNLILPERFKGNPSPVAGIENIVDVTGNITMHLHADDMLFWWKQIMYSTANTSDAPLETLRTAGAWSSPFGLTTQPSTPSRLIFTFSEAKTGTITISGKDQNGFSITETLTFSNNTSKTTTRYFLTVNPNGITTNITRQGSETLKIEGDPDVYTHSLSLGDDVPNGFTMELVKGDLPNVYTGCIINTATINLAEVMTLELGIMGKRGYTSCKLSTNAANREPVQSDSPSPLPGFTRIGEQVFPAWGSMIQFDIGAGLTTIPVQSWTLTLDNNLRYLDRFSASRWRVKPVRGGNRNYSLRAVIDYNSATDDFNDLFYGNENISAKVICYRRPSSGAEYSLTINIPKCQITAYPDPEVTDYSAIVQEITLRPLRTGATSDELGVTLKCVSNV